MEKRQRFAAELAALAVKREPLMLPAPVETIEIPGDEYDRDDSTREELAAFAKTTASS